MLLEPPEKPVLAREREARLNGEYSQSIFTTTVSEITYQQLLKIIEIHTKTSKNVSERLETSKHVKNT